MQEVHQDHDHFINSLQEIEEVTYLLSQSIRYQSLILRKES